jgi:hypothetical protein
MDEQTFKRRTKQFGLNVILLVESLPRAQAADVMARAVAALRHRSWC